MSAAFFHYLGIQVASDCHLYEIAMSILYFFLTAYPLLLSWNMTLQRRSVSVCLADSKVREEWREWVKVKLAVGTHPHLLNGFPLKS